jgi:hypothetical protein
VIFSSESAGVSGMGLVQALELAGVPGFHCQRQDDVTALMEIAASLIGDRITPAASSILTGPALPTALEFAGALHRIVGSEEGPAEAGHYDGPAEAAHHDRYDERPHDLFRDLDVEADRDEFRSEDVAPEPAHHDLVDLQLRHDEQKLPEPPMFGVTVPPAARPAPRRSLGWVLMAAMALAFGVFAGFVGGFFVARESPPPNPSVQTESPAPEATNGRTFTDAPVNEVPLAQPPAGSGASVSRPQPEVAKPEPPKPDSTKPAAAAPQPSRPAAPAQRNGRTAGATAASRPAPDAAPRTGPAAIRVESLPAGAQVFVDGRSVGYAPLIVGDLTPGTHSIRMQLPGYRPYVTAVTLGPGARERLAASLEQ